MAGTDPLAALSPYVARLLDDYVYEQLDEAAQDLRDAYRRVSGRRGARSVDDKKLQRQLQSASDAMRKALLAVQGRKEEKKKRRVIAPLVVVLGAAAVADLLSDESVLQRLFGRGEPGAGETPGAGAPDGGPASAATA